MCAWLDISRPEIGEKTNPKFLLTKKVTMRKNMFQSVPRALIDFSWTIYQTSKSLQTIFRFSGFFKMSII